MKTSNSTELERGIGIHLAGGGVPDTSTVTLPVTSQALPAHAPVTDARTSLLTEVDFKWLMAGRGCWIDVPRFHDDPAYAQACLHKGLLSSSYTLQQCAARLRDQISGRDRGNWADPPVHAMRRLGPRGTSGCLDRITG